MLLKDFLNLFVLDKIVIALYFDFHFKFAECVGTKNYLLHSIYCNYKVIKICNITYDLSKNLCIDLVIEKNK